MTIPTIAATRTSVSMPAHTEDAMITVRLPVISTGGGPQSGSVLDASSVGHDDDTVYWTRLIVMVGEVAVHSETAITAAGAPNPFFSRTVILNTTASPLLLLGFMQLKVAVSISEVLKLQLHAASMIRATSSFKVAIFASVLAF